MNRLVSLGPPTPRGAARLAQSRYLHGIDFKNPFTMSKRSVSLLVPRLVAADLVSSSLGFGARGGAYRDRTDDLMLAKQPLSQLS